MKPRHEWKHEITAADRLVLSARLSAVARRDSHGQNGRYEIRSLYFDDPKDTALREKIDGVSRREKFRIRYYSGLTNIWKRWAFCRRSFWVRTACFYPRRKRKLLENIG